MKYKELKRFYSENFGLGHLNPPPDGDYSPFEQKLILISLICYVVEKNKTKNPDITHYSLLYKLNSKLNLPDSFIKGLAIVCEDLSYQNHDFPTFNLKGKEILEKIFSILNTWTPF